MDNKHLEYEIDDLNYQIVFLKSEIKKIKDAISSLLSVVLILVTLAIPAVVTNLDVYPKQVWFFVYVILGFLQLLYNILRIHRCFQ